jgi:hypothetical protein
MRNCDCNLGFSNTGYADCKNLFSVTRKLIFVPTFDSTGARNFIAPGDTIDAAYFAAKLNETDPYKRWYPTGLLENVEDVRAEPVMETLASQKKQFIQDGIRTFKAWWVKESNVMVGKLMSLQCKDFSVYKIDRQSALIGSYDGTNLNPIMADKDTFYAMLLNMTDTTSQKIPINFEYDRSERDEDLRMISMSEMNGANALLLDGLLDVNAAISGASTTGFVAKLTTDYGTFETPIKVVGFVKADFTLYNETTHAPVSLTSATVTENPDGTYTFASVPAQSSYDVLTLSATKTGYEFPDTTVTIP